MDLQQDSRQHIEPACIALPGHDLPWLVSARQSAFERFTAHGFPARREEEWKYTDMSAIGKRASLAPAPRDPATDAAARILSQGSGHLMVFVDGHYSGELSAVGKLPAGVRLASLADRLNDAADLPKALFDQSHEHTIFAALNNAFATDGAVLNLAPGTVLETPVYLLFIASGKGAAIYPRNIVIAGEGARATVIEHYLGATDAHNFTDVVTQISLGACAQLQHCKLVQEGGNAFHVAGIHAEQAADSRFVSNSFALGGRLTRNDITSSLNEPGCLCTLNGLYLTDGMQHADHHTRIDHLAPSGTSREYYRGIMNAASHGVFNGKLIVHPHAVKTDAHQANHNLLLSRQAEADTKPQLEIYADDVKCTHGATVGQLNDDSLFYLRSRGVDAALARSLLIYGFANDIVERVGAPDLRARIRHLVLEGLPQGEQIRVML